MPKIDVQEVQNTESHSLKAPEPVKVDEQAPENSNANAFGVDVEKLQEEMADPNATQAKLEGQVLKEEEDYQLFAQQDTMIETGIEMICRRFVQLLNKLREKGIDLETEFRIEQKRWENKFVSLHHDLTNWEMEHLDKQTFSKSFEPLIDAFLVTMAKNKGIKKETVIGKVRGNANFSSIKMKQSKSITISKDTFQSSKN